MAARQTLLWLGLLAVMLAGAWLAGFLFQAGKAFAEVSQGRRIHDSLDGLAAWCAHTDFAGFLRPGLIFAAILAAVPAWECYRRSAIFRIPTPPPEPSRTGGGCGLRTRCAALLLAAMAGCLLAALRWPGGEIADHWTESPGFWFWGKTILASLAAALALELLFRGALFRVFQQAAGPRAAWWQSSLAFACFLHLAPPASWPVASPDEGGTGISMLAAWWFRLAHPLPFLGEFLPLLLWGLLLGWTRWRCHNLSLAIALQAGFLLGALPVRFLAGGQSLLSLAEIRGPAALLHPLLACLCLFAFGKWLARSCSHPAQPAAAPPKSDETPA